MHKSWDTPGVGCSDVNPKEVGGLVYCVAKDAKL
jgi:hypothetical protein